jgi:hypothetical protein
MVLVSTPNDELASRSKLTLHPWHDESEISQAYVLIVTIPDAHIDT